jgi:hypothetical protein
MSKELTFYKDKGEIFKCTALIEGAEAKDSTVRLCLEFSDHKNMYFNGSINSKGEININVPALRGMNLNEGKAILEIIADSIYFKPFESTFKIKEAVKVIIADTEHLNEERVVHEDQENKPRVSVVFSNDNTVPIKESKVPVKKSVPPKPQKELNSNGEFVSLREFLK